MWKASTAFCVVGVESGDSLTIDTENAFRTILFIAVSYISLHIQQKRSLSLKEDTTPAVKTSKMTQNYHLCQRLSNTCICFTIYQISLISNFYKRRENILHCQLRNNANDLKLLNFLFMKLLFVTHSVLQWITSFSIWVFFEILQLYVPVSLNAHVFLYEICIKSYNVQYVRTCYVLT